MAARPLLQQLNRTPDSQYYVCSACNTRIASLDDLEYRLVVHPPHPNPQLNGPDASKHVFNAAVNLQVVRAGNDRLVNCASCNQHLGKKIKVPLASNGPRNLLETKFELISRMILFWNGNQIVNADVP